MTRRQLLVALGAMGAASLLGTSLSTVCAQPTTSSPSDVAFLQGSTLRLQQLVGDVDVTRMQADSEPYWHPTDTRSGQENSVGYYPGGPPIKRSDSQLWSDPNAVGPSAPFPDGPTPQLGYLYNIFGSDKGRCFTGPDGNLIMVFGDIRGQTQAPYDTIGYSDSSDPELANGPVGMDLWCYTSTKSSFPKQPKNESDPRPPAYNGPYTLLTFPSNPRDLPNPLSLKFSVEDMGVDDSPFSGVSIVRADDPSKSATYVTFRFRTLPIAGALAPGSSAGARPFGDGSANPVRPPGQPAAEWYAQLQEEPGIGAANVLTKFNYASSPRGLKPADVDPKRAFEYLRVISQTPFKQNASGAIVALDSTFPTSPCFLNTALHRYDATYPSYASSGLGAAPASGGYLLSFGTGTFRGPITVVQPTLINGRTDYVPTLYDLSTVFLSAQDYADVESSSHGPIIFNGLTAGTGTPQWTSSIDIADAYPVLGGSPGSFAYTGIGDVSVACVRNQQANVPELWLMLCDGSLANGWPYEGIQLFWSVTPWGPWQPASQTGRVGVFTTPDAQGDPRSGGFIQQPVTSSGAAGDGLNGPAIGAEKNSVDAAGRPANADPFKAYGPMLVEKFCKVVPDPNGGSSPTLTIYWTMCTWIPYYVVLMRSQFSLSL